MRSKLIVALDFRSSSEAYHIVEQLDPNLVAVKIGSEMYTLFGPDFVKRIIAKGFKVFLDLKFHDIPNTVAASAKAAAELGVWMFNVHASGGDKMMRAAKEALIEYGDNRPILLGVTVLTSMSTPELNEIGVSATVDEQVLHLTSMVHAAGLDGVVCSAKEAAEIKKRYGESMLTVTPGIRLPGSQQDDQHRIISPMDAIRAGSDCLVVGRPITRAASPQLIVDDILSSINQALSEQ